MQYTLDDRHVLNTPTLSQMDTNSDLHTCTDQTEDRIA